MGILIVFIVVVAVGLILINKYDNDECGDWVALVGILLSIIGGISVVIMLLCASTLPADFAYIEERYNNLQTQLENVECDDIVTGENLRNQVLDMNNEISKHKCYSQNMWVSMWYSKRIGNLEPLEWKSTKAKED